MACRWSPSTCSETAGQVAPGAASLLPRSVEESLFGTLMRVTSGESAAGEGRGERLGRTVGAGPYRCGQGGPGHRGGQGQHPGVQRRDGSQVTADLVVLATGYRIDLPFLSSEMLDITGNQLPLYQRVVAPQRPGLWFVGFVDTSYGAIPLFEHQAEWIGALLAGAAVLPSRTTMRTWLERDAGDIAKRFPDPTTHGLQVDHWRYIKGAAGGTRPATPTVPDHAPTALIGPSEPDSGAHRPGSERHHGRHAGHPTDYAAARSQLHTVAEWLLAGPQYSTSATIKLRGGRRHVADRRCARRRGDRGRLSGRWRDPPLRGTVSELGAAAGLPCERPEVQYHDPVPGGLTTALTASQPAYASVLHVFTIGHRALTHFSDETPIVWPEHFDQAIRVGSVNYGISPGDSFSTQPYAYVGPDHTDGNDFWNARSVLPCHSTRTIPRQARWCARSSTKGAA